MFPTLLLYLSPNPFPLSFSQPFLSTPPLCPSTNLSSQPLPFVPFPTCPLNPSLCPFPVNPSPFSLLPTFPLNPSPLSLSQPVLSTHPICPYPVNPSPFPNLSPHPDATYYEDMTIDKTSQSSRLLYCKEIPTYKQHVREFYGEIQTCRPVTGS